jgi:signal transduction histidine kinase
VDSGADEHTARRSVKADRVVDAVVATRAPHIEIGSVDDAGECSLPERAGVFGLLGVPVLGAHGRVIGVLEVHNSERAFFEDDVSLLQGLAAALAIALENARAIARLEEHGRQLMEQRSTMRALASELALTEERERHTIAADLHDGIGQALQICKMLVARASTAADPVELAEMLTNAESLLAQTIHDTRTLMFEISPPVLYDIGLEAALEWLIDNQKPSTAARCTYVDDGSEKPLSATVGALVYRMARELLMNAVRHAQASEIELSACRLGDRLVVEVTDNGVGFDPAAAVGGLGLRGLREQISSLGGRLEMRSDAGSGTSARLWMPLDGTGEAGRHRAAEHDLAPAGGATGI